MITRRQVIGSGLAGGALAGLGPMGSAFARSKDPRFVFVLLRGGMDGMAALPPYGDPGYQKARGELTLEKTVKLDETFGLHPNLGRLKPYWTRGELAVAPAIATPYRDRSHFDVQIVLETGLETPKPNSDGWLNRVIAQTGHEAVAIGHTVPQILNGQAPVTSWAPPRLPGASPTYLESLSKLYARDPNLSEAFEAGLKARNLVEMRDEAGQMNKNFGKKGSRPKLHDLARAASQFLRDPKGPRIAVVDSAGWDTHANQGTLDGRLARQLLFLGQALDTFKGELGPVWDDTVIVAATEFGRTARINGTKGTDHGTGGAAFVMGGAVKGGKILGEWPGLSGKGLYEGRDVLPTADIRGLCAAILLNHMKLDDQIVFGSAFPGLADRAVLGQFV